MDDAEVRSAEDFELLGGGDDAASPAGALLDVFLERGRCDSGGERF